MTDRRMTIANIANQNLEGIDPLRFQSTLQSEHTLRVPLLAPAVEVAKLADAMQAGLVIIYDPAQQIHGVVAPEWVKERVSRILGKPFSTLAEALEDMAHDPIEQQRGFHHEQLTEDRVTLYFCSAGHYTSSKPCPHHEGGGGA